MKCNSWIGKNDIVNHDGAAFVAFNKEFKNEAELILQTLYDGKEIVVNGALGNVQYALLALVGGLLAINGIGNVSVGLIVSFLHDQRRRYNNDTP